MFNTIDIYIGISIILFFLFGIWAGLIRSIISLLGVYFAVFTAQSLAPSLVSAASVVAAETSKTGYVSLLLVIFGIVYIAVEAACLFLRNIINVQILGPVDSFLGGLVSVFKVLVIAGMIISSILMLSLSDEQANSINQSVLKKPAVNSYKMTYPLALSAASKITGFFAQKIVPQVKEKTSATIAVVTSEAAKISIKSAEKIIDNHPRSF